MSDKTETTKFDWKKHNAESRKLQADIVRSARNIHGREFAKGVVKKARQYMKEMIEGKTVQ